MLCGNAHQNPGARPSPMINHSIDCFQSNISFLPPIRLAFEISIIKNYHIRQHYMPLLCSLCDYGYLANYGKVFQRIRARTRVTNKILPKNLPIWTAYEPSYMLLRLHTSSSIEIVNVAYLFKTTESPILVKPQALDF